MSREFPERPVVGVGAVVLRPGALSPSGCEVLLVRRANPPRQGEWSLPGGAVELGERLEEAVVREVLEETGLEIALDGVVEVLEMIDQEGRGAPVRFHYVLIDYLGHVAGGTLRCASDAADAYWQRVDELGSEGGLALRPKTLDVVRKAVVMWDRADGTDDEDPDLQGKK